MTELSPHATQAETAEAIADALVQTAIVDGERCTWLAATVELEEERRRVVHHTGNPSLYEGDAGIAWALAHASAVLGRDDLAELARAGATGALRRMDLAAGRGLYDGAAGVAVAALQVGIAVGDDDLAAQALESLETAIARPPTGDDIIGGTAGLILAAIAAEAVTGDRRWLQSAVDLAGSLLGTAQRRPWGWSWPSGEPGEPGLCGLAHGSGGIAWALGELGARMPSDELDAAVREALRYERSWFDRERGNWPDLRVAVRDADGGRAFPAWWCHGAVGAGLVRLRLWQLGRDDPGLLAEAAVTFRTTFASAAASLRAGRADDFGLAVCHGVGGAVELFLQAHAVLGEEEHLITAHWLLDRAIAILGGKVEWWPDGVGGTGAGPGLMTGMAGMLVVLTRAMEVGRIPSVGLFPLGH